MVLMPVDLDRLMEEAIKEAEEGFREGEIPIGALVVDLEGRVISSAHNRPIALNDPTAHAEILALRKAGWLCGNYRLTHTMLVVTLEPCPMCMGAAINARISRLVFGASDAKAGAAGSLYRLGADGKLNHTIEVVSGVMEERCRTLLQDFFHVRRKT
jgi:tRNA(adenine34) deaminase